MFRVGVYDNGGNQSLLGLGFRHKGMDWGSSDGDLRDFSILDEIHIVIPSFLHHEEHPNHMLYVFSFVLLSASILRSEGRVVRITGYGLPWTCLEHCEQVILVFFEHRCRGTAVAPAAVRVHETKKRARTKTTTAWRMRTLFYILLRKKHCFRDIESRASFGSGFHHFTLT